MFKERLLGHRAAVKNCGQALGGMTPTLTSILDSLSGHQAKALSPNITVITAADLRRFFKLHSREPLGLRLRISSSSQDAKHINEYGCLVMPRIPSPSPSLKGTPYARSSWQQETEILTE